MKYFYRIYLTFSVLLCIKGTAQEQIIYRSEYEQVGDYICDVNMAGEGISAYSITNGNSDNYFTIDASTGVISIQAVIQDVYGAVTMHDLTIKCGTQQQQIRIVDGYDYWLSQHSDYVVLDKHLDSYIMENNPYSGYNNLWGRGDAAEGTDFRMATLCHPDLPEQTLFLWDTPSTAKDFNGASVWSYINVLWGNRKGYREDLEGFPLQLSSIQSMQLDFDFEQLYGTEDYKIALNHFLTDEGYIDAFSSNDGDFFLVFDQKGTWIPPYPVELPDTVINSCDFARLYKSENGYEWRRVIIKNNQKLLKGSIDMKGIYDGFISRGYLNVNQCIPNIQVGLEITSGYGALRMNQWRIHVNDSTVGIEEHYTKQGLVYPNPSSGIFRLKEVAGWQVFSLDGALIKSGNNDEVDLSNYPSGVYILNIEKQSLKLVKL